MRSAGRRARSSASIDHAPGRALVSLPLPLARPPELPVRNPVWMKRVAGWRPDAQ